MLQIIFREHILRYRIVNNPQVQKLIEMGRNFSVEYIVPLYISLKATILVTKEMVLEFL